MQAVAADQGEEGRQEGAARRAGAARDQAGEFVDLQGQEGGAEHEGHGHRDVERSVRCARGARCWPCRR